MSRPLWTSLLAWSLAGSFTCVSTVAAAQPRTHHHRRGDTPREHADDGSQPELPAPPAPIEQLTLPGPPPPMPPAPWMHGHHDRAPRIYERRIIRRVGPRQPDLGGIGYASVGMMAGSFGVLQRTLQSPAVLGPGFDIATGMPVFGAGGGAFIAGLWLGVKGFGFGASTSPGAQGTATFNGAGGAFELGYGIFRAPGFLIVPFVGVGGLSYQLKVKNRSGVPITVYPGETIAAQSSSDFSAGVLTGEVGLRVFRLLFSGSGGFAVGGEIGYMAALKRSPWTGPQDQKVGQESSDLGAGFVRITIGAGGFSYKDRRRGEWRGVDADITSEDEGPPR